MLQKSIGYCMPVAVLFLITWILSATSVLATPVFEDFAALGNIGNQGTSYIVNPDLTLEARTSLEDGSLSGSGDSLTGGDEGTVFIGELSKQNADENVFNCPALVDENCGAGAQNNENPDPGGSQGISGEGGDKDESLIFDFTSSDTTADSIIMGLIGLNCLDGTTGTKCDKNDIISLTIEFSDAAAQIIASVNGDISATPDGLGSLDFAVLTLNGTKVDRFAIRVLEGHFGVTGIEYELVGALDDDGDGVTNDLDLCPGTPPGEEVDTDGCSASQLCDVLVPTIVGTEGRDVIYGTEGPDVIFGLGGNDVIYGEGGDDVICGGSGDDQLLDGGSGNDTVFGESGNDTLDGGAGDDTLDGGSGDDRLLGRRGDDTLNGGTGDDQLVGDQGSDTLDGGADTDACDGGRDRDTDTAVNCETETNIP